MEKRLKELYKKIDELEASERWPDLVEVYQECISISLEIYGEYHDETLALYVEYGGLLRNLGRYDESLEVLHKALHCAGVLKGTDHLDYASALVNLANLLRMMKCYQESETLFLQAKSLFERKNATQLIQYVSLCNNLGLLYQEMDRYEESIPLHNVCLDILKSDTEHEILYGITLNNLVEPYKRIGDHEKAIQLLKQAISIFFRNIDHASVLFAAAMNNLGIIYYEDQDYGKAKQCFETSMNISKEKLGRESESYKHSLVNYKKTMEQISNKYPSFEPFAAATENDISESSKGLDIAEGYFWEVCYPMLKEKFPEYLPRMAAGLVGEGSECYGFDDEISRDHDFGPSFQIFIPKTDKNLYGRNLEAQLALLPKTYRGFQARNTCSLGEGRTGLLTIEEFYDKFLSIHEVPASLSIWRQMEDIPLSTATNGRVFMDNLGEFTRIRKGLLNHYPKDVLLKRLAFHCTQIAQSGQYNLPRSLKRKQYVAASHALNEFIRHYTSFIYLINRTYKSYYKWEHEGLKTLPILGQTSYDELAKLVLIPLQANPKYVVFVVEELCKKIITYLKEKHVTDNDSDFLLYHVPSLLSHIKDDALRTSNPWLEK